MTGYKIFLTSSSEVACLLADAIEVGENDVIKISHGKAERYSLIPDVYMNQGYYACVIIYENLKRPMYEVVFA